MYTEQDLKAVDSQISKRLRWIGAAVLLLLAVLVFTWVIRMEVLSMVAGGLTAAVIIFCYDISFIINTNSTKCGPVSN